MQSLTIPNSSSFYKYHEINQKFQNESKGLINDQIALIKYIYSLLSIREFRSGYGFSYRTLNNLIIDFFNLNTKCFISKKAFSDLERKNLFMSKDQISKKDITKNCFDIEIFQKFFSKYSCWTVYWICNNNFITRSCNTKYG